MGLFEDKAVSRNYLELAHKYPFNILQARIVRNNLSAASNIYTKVYLGLNDNTIDAFSEMKNSFTIKLNNISKFLWLNFLFIKYLVSS